jgi:hypothetical protein
MPIIKILTRKNKTHQQLIEYVTKDNKGFVLTHNLKGNKIKDWVKQYKENEIHRQNNRKDNIYLYHEILSWHKKDTKDLTEEKLKDMVKHYIQLRNPKGMYIVGLDTDKDHLHVHLAISGLEYKTGKAMRLSKTDLSKLKTDFQNYQLQKYPELSSIVKHGKGSKSTLSDAEFQLKMRDSRMTDKDQVLEILNACFKQAKSKDDFFEKLKDKEITTYMRSGKLTGILYKNKKHRLARLGFDEEQLQKLDKAQDRNKELRELRGDSKDKNITRTK